VGHGLDASAGGWMSQAAENPCDSMPSAVLLRVAKFENAMNTVSSTIAAGPSRSSRRADSSSVTVGEVFVMASTYSSVSRSSAVNTSDSRQRVTRLALA